MLTPFMLQVIELLGFELSSTEMGSWTFLIIPKH